MGYTVKEVYDRIGMAKVNIHILPYVYNQSDVLNIAEIWDGGSTEGHIFVQKHENKYILFELIHYFNSGETKNYEYAIKNIDNIKDIISEIEFFCQNRYMGTMSFDFSKLIYHKEVLQFFKENNYCVGDVISFGSFPNGGDKGDAIEWIVLDEEENFYVLISKYALDTVGYCSPEWNGNLDTLIWENSFLRNWLNEEFYQTAFSDIERKKIVEKKIITIDNLHESSYKNFVHILSSEEVEKYFPVIEQRKVIPIGYAVSKGARMGWTSETKMYTSWWILPYIEITEGTPTRMDYPQAVFQNGEIGYHSRNAFHQDFTIRPVLLLKK